MVTKFLTLSRPGSGKIFWATKSQKLNLGTFLALKQPKKPSQTILGFLVQALEASKISMYILIEKFKFSKKKQFQWCNATQIKAEIMYNSD